MYAGHWKHYLRCEDLSSNKKHNGRWLKEGRARLPRPGLDWRWRWTDGGGVAAGRNPVVGRTKWVTYCCWTRRGKRLLRRQRLQRRRPPWRRPLSSDWLSADLPLPRVTRTRREKIARTRPSWSLRVGLLEKWMRNRTALSALRPM